MKYGSIIAALSIVILGACSSNTVKDTLGLNRSAPDEFRVVSRPPLSVPPQFTLRPPSTSETSPNQLAADKQAQSLMTGATSADTAVVPVKTKTAAKKADSQPGNTVGDSQFLAHAGADKADPSVREKLVEEKYTVQEQEEGGSWWNPFASSNVKKDPVVNAKKEAERIDKNEDAGKPVTEGDTPEVKAKDTGVLGRIFGY